MFLYENHEMVRTASSPLSPISISPAERDPPGRRAGGDLHLLEPGGAGAGHHAAGDQVRVLEAGFGVTKIGYQIPGYTEAFVTEWDLRGRLVLVRPPGGDGLLVYTWRGDDSLERILAGDRRTDYLYTEGQLSSVDHQRDGVNIKTSFQYNQGSVAFW